MPVRMCKNNLLFSVLSKSVKTLLAINDLTDNPYFDEITRPADFFSAFLISRLDHSVHSYIIVGPFSYFTCGMFSNVLKASRYMIYDFCLQLTFELSTLALKLGRAIKAFPRVNGEFTVYLLLLQFLIL